MTEVKPALQSIYVLRSNKSDANRPRLTPNQVWYPSKSNDFVLRWNVDQALSSLPSDLDSNWLTPIVERLQSTEMQDSQKPTVIEDMVRLKFDGKEPLEARALLTLCYSKRLLSASLRLSGKKTPEHHFGPPVKTKHEFFTREQVDRSESEFLFSPDAVADVLLERLQLVENVATSPAVGFSLGQPRVKIKTHPSGLIVVAGGTGTGKSDYARAIILRWLIRLGASEYDDLPDKAKYSPPHLVTVEDPIESWEVHAYDKNRNRTEIKLHADCQSDLALGLRLTARAKGSDVNSLHEAHLHALRQKPVIVYIGESREEEDWKVALELGATGHLVVTTCHASSLVDTFSKLSGERGKNAQDRQQLASSLLGVVHLKNSLIEKPPETQLKLSQSFFHLWRQSPESVNNFVVDGLASLVTDGQNVVSRKSLAKEILTRQRDSGYDLVTKPELYDSLITSAEKAAFYLDLRAS